VQDCTLIGLAVAPLTVPLLAAANPDSLHATHPAPHALSKFREQAPAHPHRHRQPAARGGGLVGDHALEQDRMVAGRLAGYLSADLFFGA
jgi:hypothetical protein